MPNICWADLKKINKVGPSNTVDGTIDPALHYTVTKENNGLNVILY